MLKQKISYFVVNFFKFLVLKTKKSEKVIMIYRFQTKNSSKLFVRTFDKNVISRISVRMKKKVIKPPIDERFNISVKIEKRDN